VAVFVTAATAATFSLFGQVILAVIFGLGTAADAWVAVRFWNKPNDEKSNEENYPRDPLAWP
jgi:hypothetical protein